MNAFFVHQHFCCLKFFLAAVHKQYKCENEWVKNLADNCEKV